MRILVRAALNTYTGYGRDGVGLVKALEELGHQVYLMPDSLTPPLPYAALRPLSRPYEPPFHLAIVHLDPFMLHIPVGVRATSARVVGWTMWEFESLAGRRGSSRRQIRRNLDWFDGVYAYDEVSKKAIQKYVPDNCQLEVLQGGYDASEWEWLPRDWSGVFRYCMVGALHKRKAPEKAVQAFLELQEEHGAAFNAELHLKTVDVKLPEWWGEHPGIVTYDRIWEHDRMEKFYQNCHVYLAPSIGEGKNLPALEAQTTGMAAIASNFGGHTGWLDPGYSYPLQVERKRYFRKGVGANASVSHLKELMWYAYTHREEVRKKGMLASEIVRHEMDWKRKARLLVASAMEIPPRSLYSVEIGAEERKIPGRVG